jgi:hypothetical protein
LKKKRAFLPLSLHKSSPRTLLTLSTSSYLTTLLKWQHFERKKEEKWEDGRMAANLGAISKERDEIDKSAFVQARQPKDARFSLSNTLFLSRSSAWLENV